MTDDTSDPSDNRRGDDRRTALKSGHIVFNDGKSTQPCKIRNISEGGAKLEFGTPQLLPHTFELHVTGLAPLLCSLRWAKGSAVGVQFITEDSQD